MTDPPNKPGSSPMPWPTSGRAVPVGPNNVFAVIDRLNGRRAVEAARHGDWSIMLDFLKPRLEADAEVWEAIQSLLKGEFAITSLKVDKRKMPNKVKDERDNDIINFVLNEMYDGKSISVAVQNALVMASVEYGIEREGTIWEIIRPMKWLTDRISSPHATTDDLKDHP